MMQSEIEVVIENVVEETPGFLVLRNRSRLPGTLPFAPAYQKKSVPSLRKRFSVWNYIEWFLLAAVSAVLISTISIHSLRHKQYFGIYLWKLISSLLAIVGTRLACAMVVRLIVCLLHRLFRSFHRFLYVVNKVKRIVQWSLMAWVILVVWEVVYGELETKSHSGVMKVIEKILVACGIVLSVWVVKSVLVMSLAAWFHMRIYHEKISETLFFQYVVEALWGPPLVEYSLYLPTNANRGLKELQKFNPKGLSPWEMKKMMIENEEGVAVNIRTESEAKEKAETIFRNVAKSFSQFIDLEDLKKHLPTDEALKTLNLFRNTYEEDENIKISKFFLQEWMVYSFKRQRCLFLSLKDTDTASNTLGTIFSVVFGIILAAVSFPLLGWSGTKYLYFLATSSFVLTFFAGQIAKEMFFKLHLFYIRHPFDVGDEVKIEQTEMYVEKLKITDTDFIGRDKQRYTIGNYVLCEKLVMNQSRSELPAWETENIV